MTDIDLAAIRAVHLYPERNATREVILLGKLCNEVERLRAENAACRGNDLAGDPSKWPHAAQIEGLGMQVATMRPVVEAAVALVPNEYDEVYGPTLVALLAAVAAYEQEQGSQPSPVSASAGSDAKVKTAAGDQRAHIIRLAEEIEAEYDMSGLAGGLYEDFAVDVALRYTGALRALVARKNAALEEAGKALHVATLMARGRTDGSRQVMATARDAARNAYGEGDV